MSTSQTQGSPFLTLVEFYEANEKKIGINALRAWARAGRLKTVRIGRKYLVLKSELERLAEIAEDPS